MASKSDEYLKKLLPMFRAEAEGQLQAISAGLLALGSNGSSKQEADIIETVFREAHSLKGAARAVNLTEIEAACQSLEDVFAALKGGSLVPSPLLRDLLLQIVDALGGAVGGDGPVSGAMAAHLSRLSRRLTSMMRGSASEPEGTGSTESDLALRDDPTPNHSMAAGHVDDSNDKEEEASASTQAVTPVLAPSMIRVSSGKLDSVIHQVEELLLPRLTMGQRIKELQEVAVTLAGWEKRWLHVQPSMRLIEQQLRVSHKNDAVSTETHDLARLHKYLDGEQERLHTAGNQLASLLRRAEHARRALVRMTDGLMEDVKEMQLLPFSSLLDILPRYARELARQQGKRITVVTRGGDIEIDRRLLQEVKDPLIHLLRNCIDHGIERPVAREAEGKPGQGTIIFSCSRSDNMAEIQVADDGRGIDVAGLKAAAHKLGLASSGEMDEIDQSEAIALVFQSGVTTSPVITDISGRGLGLAIVREKVERLGGSIRVDSSSGVGTAFHILLPLTRANFRGVLVRSSARTFVIPSVDVERVIRTSRDEIRRVKSRETIRVGERPVPLIPLADVLELPRLTEGNPGVSGDSGDSRDSRAGAAGHVVAVVLRAGATPIAIQVDEVSGEQEILFKPLGEPLKRVRNVAGVSVLGTGCIVPVLNVSDLIKSAVIHSAAPPTAPGSLPAAPPGTASSRSILVVEDSITARTLLKHILESAGYRVVTAVDGADGYSMLGTGAFDLVVSDIEMPRLDGFALTSLIREDQRFSGLPVVLVTGLDSAEHRERGLDCGANAYIAKSSFDQSNLLEVVRRFIGKADRTFP